MISFHLDFLLQTQTYWGLGLQYMILEGLKHSASTRTSGLFLFHIFYPFAEASSPGFLLICRREEKAELVKNVFKILFHHKWNRKYVKLK
jgi:hypothetical protein